MARKRCAGFRAPTPCNRDRAPSNRLLFRLPVARQLLSLGELIGLQLAGDVVALLLGCAALFTRQLSGSEIAPHVAHHRILGDALALEVQPAQMELRARIALLSGKRVPSCSLIRVGSRTVLARLVDVAEEILRIGV